MPFTLAHPAIVIPLFRFNKKLSAEGLITGSMIPDASFVLYLREMPHADHSFHDLVLYYLPLSFVAYFLFQFIVRNMLISNLPNCYASKFEKSAEKTTDDFQLSSLLQLLLSITIGMASHVGWDAFTHADGFFVREIPLLGRNLFDTSLPVYFLLQLIFSIAGLLAIHLHIISKPDLNNVLHTNTTRQKFWLINLVIFVAIMAIRLLFWPQFNTGWGIIIALTGASFYSVLIASALTFYFQNEITYDTNIHNIQKYQG